MSDRWKWDLESSGDFSVASVRKIIDDKSLPDVDSKTRWIKYVLIKVNVHAWKVKTDSLPTRFNVSHRGIDIDSIMCAICDNEVETSRHLFFSCCMVRQIVRKVTRWWDVPYVGVDSYEDWYNWFVNLQIPSKHKQMFEGIDVMRRLVGSSTPPRYSPGASTPPSYSLGTSRNAECSNCKHLLDKITVLEATVDMYMHPEQHTVNSAALFHKVYNNMGKIDLK
ncbi:RNA-directed DNA polymerase, eukaryota [Tanacetum coccineum]